MRCFSYLRVEWLRLLRSPVTWLTLLAASLTPLIGYGIWQPAGTVTTAAVVLANPLLAGALGGSFLFSALTVYELNRVKKYHMEAITDSIVPPLTAAAVKAICLLLAAILWAAAVAALYLPYTIYSLGSSFQPGEYLRFSAIFLLPMPVMAILMTAAFWQLFRRADLSFIAFTAVMLIGLGPWNTDTYLLYWIDLSSLGFSGDLGNTAIYRMAAYSRAIWLLWFGGLWLFSILCIRVHGKKLPGSLIRNVRKIWLPITAAVMVAGGAFLFAGQPYMDHESPLEPDESGAVSTGGGFTVYIGEEEEAASLLLQQTWLDLRFDTAAGAVEGQVRYRLDNSAGTAGEYLLQASTGCEIRQITVNGEPVSFTDLDNDYYILMKDIAVELPEDDILDVVIDYRCSPQIPAHAGSLILYYEISPEYICLGGLHAAPSFREARETETCSYTGQVTLPTGMELVSSGQTPRIAQDNGDGTTLWNISGPGSRTVIFAGDYRRIRIPGTEFPVYFCYSRNHQEAFEEMNIEELLHQVVTYCTEHYGSLPYTEDYPLNIVMTSAHLMGGGASDNLSYMGESFFTAENLTDPAKGGSAAEVIAHEIIHQWWGVQRMAIDMENSDWSAEALTCYATYHMMKELKGEDYARQNYIEVWQEKYQNMLDNFYLRHPEYQDVLSADQRAALDALIFDASTYAKAPLQILKAEQLAGGEEQMDQILRELFQNGGTELPPYVTWQDFLDACGLTEEQLTLTPEDIADTGTNTPSPSQAQSGRNQKISAEGGSKN